MLDHYKKLEELIDASYKSIKNNSLMKRKECVRCIYMSKVSMKRP